MKSLLVSAAFSLLAASAAANPQTLKWAWEDGNHDGVWNYSTSNWNFLSGNEWTNIKLTSDAYQGHSSMYFKYLNEDLVDGSSYTQAFGFALIPTSKANNGTEPKNAAEAEAGKDLRQYDSLEFYIKGSPGANQSAFNVWLRSPNGHGSVQVPLKNYLQVSGNWPKVLIPLKDLLPAVSNPNHFQQWDVNYVGFYVTQDEANVPFDFYVDNISFVKNNRSLIPDTRYWWTSDVNNDGAYNYTSTTMLGGTSIKVANQWGDVAIGHIMTGPYGETRFPSIDLHFDHNGSGYAEANLATAIANTGFEPSSAEERDAGKALSSESASLKFSAPGIANGVKVKLVDQYGRASKAVSINDYRSSYGRYSFSFDIPTQVFAGNGFDFNAVKSVTFFIDSSAPAGEYKLSLLSLFFQKAAL